jgi:predicted phage terminase large subunit-like protein
MLFLPPRHGKSETTTIRLPAYWLERDPAQRVIIGAYNQTLAEKFSRRARTIVQERGIAQIDPNRYAVLDWQTTRGGGVRAVGVGGGITGIGGNLIIIDDPVKSRAEANSETYRDRCYEWYTNDLYTRLEPGGAIILIQTRWHEDDLAGRILASDQGSEWTVVSLPAEAEANDPLGRPVGAALCPDRYDLAALADIKATMLLDYYALYQQRPQPASGGMFGALPPESYVPASPVRARRVRAWDIAASDGKGDYTVGVLVAAAGDGTYTVEDVVRGQWGTDARDRMMRQTAETDQSRYGHVSVLVPQDPGAAGKSQAGAFIKLFAGFPIEALLESGDKVVRADALSSQWNAGNVSILRGAWNADYLDELTRFPSAKHDDQVDASANAFNKLASSRGGGVYVL